MSKSEGDEITLLLSAWSSGDETALESLMPLVYDELRRIARRHMRRQSAGHTFQTTELIHEAYLKIVAGGNHSFNDRAHFFGVAARAMRHILVDYARSKSSQKRGGWQERVTLEDSLGLGSNASNEIVRLNDAMNELASLDERKFRVVELKYFGGLTNDEVATVLKISPETVKRDWRFSRTWLLKELSMSPN